EVSYLTPPYMAATVPCLTTAPKDHIQCTTDFRRNTFDNCTKYDNLTDKIQALGRLTTDKIKALERLNSKNKKKMIDNIQALERLTNENKNLADKIQVLEGLTIDKIQALKRPTDENKKNTQTQTEDFRAEPTIHCIMKQKRSGLRSEPSL
ncbi:hypothetical protein STEG23_019659, partial [Scotinomys teguina]